jgi:hypothetical protein
LHHCDSSFSNEYQNRGNSNNSALAVTNCVEITPFKQRKNSSESHLKNLPSQQKEGKDANRDTSFGLCRASEISKHLGYLNQVAAAQEMS